MNDILKFDFCKVHIFDYYLIVNMNEGITVTPNNNQVLLNIVDTYYKNKKFVYITHRIHSYSVDPAIYRETSKIDNLIGFAIVSKDYKAKSNAEIEKLFLAKPFGIFGTIKEAVSWTKSLNPHPFKLKK